MAMTSFLAVLSCITSDVEKAKKTVVYYSLHGLFGEFKKRTKVDCMPFPIFSACVERACEISAISSYTETSGLVVIVRPDVFQEFLERVPGILSGDSVNRDSVDAVARYVYAMVHCDEDMLQTYTGDGVEVIDGYENSRAKTAVLCECLLLGILFERRISDVDVSMDEGDFMLDVPDDYENVKMRLEAFGLADAAKKHYAGMCTIMLESA